MQRFILQALGLLTLCLWCSATTLAQGPPPGGGSTGGGYGDPGGGDPGYGGGSYGGGGSGGGDPGYGGGGSGGGGSSGGSNTGTGNASDVIGGSAVRDNATGAVGTNCGACPTKEEPAVGTKRSGAGGLMMQEKTCLIAPGASVDGDSDYQDSSSCCDSGSGAPSVTTQGGGCGSCGGGGTSGGSSGQGLASYTLHKATRKWAPWNRPTQSSFGPGVFSRYDSKVYFYPDSVSGLTAVVFDAEKALAFNFVDGLDGDPLDGTMHDLRNTAYESLVLKDANDAVVTDVTVADHVQLSYWGGFQESYDIVDLSTDPLNPEYAARLQSATDRNGNTLSIAYRDSLAAGAGGFTAQELTDAPDRRWQIHQITDAVGDVATYSYKSTQESGRWVVEKIDFPNGTDADYSYTDGHLSTVDHPNGDTSTYAYGQDNIAQTATVIVNNAGGGPAQTMHLTNDYMTLDANGQAAVINQPQGVFRMAVSNAAETLSMIVPDADQAGVYDVYHGTGSASNVVYGVSTAYYSDGWTPMLQTHSVTISITPDGTAEDEYAEVDPATTIDDFYRGTIPGETDETGREYSYEYDADGFLTKKIFDADSTYEEYAYNSFKQTTRLRDRQGNVVQYEYDANGNLTKQKTGLKEVGGLDVAQPEYAETEWAYYPVGHANVGLLKTAYDAEWDGSSSDLHRTDYEYNARGLMTKMLESASVSGGDRPETLWTYDTDDRVATTTDPGGHQSDDTYNDRSELIEKSYDDASTQQTLYGAIGTPEEGLVVKTKDRRNVVTSYAYDSAGRMTQVTVGTAWDADILDGNADDTPITDRNEQSITTYMYLDGTELPIEVVRDGSKTEFVYDYRQRVIETKVYPYANKIMSSKVVYVDNKKFSDEDYYGRKKYYGYRASDGQLIRHVAGAYPSFTLADQTAVFNLVRDTNLNPAFTIKDAITDENGRPETVIDERGTQFLTEYNAASQVIRETKAVGTPVETITEMDYDEDGNVIEIRSPRYFDSTDTNGYQKCKTVMTYDGQGRVLTRTEAPGTPEVATESYAYDSEGRQVTRTDARGKVWTTSYASCCGHSVSSKNPLGHGSISNKDNGGLVTHTAGIGDVDSHTSMLDPIDAKTLRETTTRYDALGHNIAACTWLVPQGTIDPENPPMAGLDGINGQDGLTSQTIWDLDLTDGIGLDSNAGATVTNPLGGSFTASLSQAINKLGAPLPNGGADISFAADCTGLAIVEVNPENEMTFQIYDGIGTLVAFGKLESPLSITHCSDVQEYVFLQHSSGTRGGQIVETITTIDADSHISSTQSSGTGDISSSNSDGGTWSLSHQLSASKIATTTPDSSTIEKDLDALGRTKSIRSASGIISQVARNKQGEVSLITEGSGLQTEFHYNSISEQTKSSISGYGDETFSTASGLLTRRTDRDNEGTDFVYDDLGRVIEKSKFTSGGLTGHTKYFYSYDAAGRLAQRVHPDGTVEALSYDMASRLNQRTYSGSTRPHLFGGVFTETFQYDRALRLVAATSSLHANSIAFEYDKFGRKVVEKLLIDGHVFTTQQEFDRRGYLSRYSLPDGSMCDRTYTASGLLKTAHYSDSPVAPQELIASMTYDNSGRETSRVFGNGITTTLTSDADGNVASSSTPGVQSLSFTRDANGWLNGEVRTGVASLHGWSVPPNGFHALGWLQQLDSPTGGSFVATRSAEGQLLSQTYGGEHFTRTYGPQHRVSSVHKTNPPSVTQLAYDNLGNLVDDGEGLQIKYDFRANIMELTTGSVTDITARYDAIGRMVAKSQTSSTGSGGEYLISLGDRRVAEVDSTTNSLARKYFCGDQLDDYLGLKDTSSSILYLHNSPSKSLYAVSDSSGNDVAHFAYDHFGRRQVVSTSGSFSGQPLELSYTGQFQLYSLPLMNFRSRFYLASLGSFCSPDRLGKQGGNNEYASYFELDGTDAFGYSPDDAPKRKRVVMRFTEVEAEWRWNMAPPNFVKLGPVDCRIEWTQYKFEKTTISESEEGERLERDPGKEAQKQNELSELAKSIKDKKNLQKQYSASAHIWTGLSVGSGIVAGVLNRVAQYTPPPLRWKIQAAAATAAATSVASGAIAYYYQELAATADAEIERLQKARKEVNRRDTGSWQKYRIPLRITQTGKFVLAKPFKSKVLSQGTANMDYCCGKKVWDGSVFPPPPPEFGGTRVKSQGYHFPK